VLWPHKEGSTPMAKVKILKQFVSGRMYIPGQITDIEEEKLDDFLRAGYIQLLNEEEPKVKIVNKPAARKKAVKHGDN
jgi:hypothetical protein